jgi:hypothetical protein
MITNQAELAARLERALASSEDLRLERSVLLALAEKNLASIRAKGALTGQLRIEVRTRLLSSQQDLEKATRLLSQLAAL